MTAAPRHVTPSEVSYILDRDSYADQCIAHVDRLLEERRAKRRAEVEARIVSIHAVRMLRTEEIARLVGGGQ